jgi:porin
MDLSRRSRLPRFIGTALIFMSLISVGHASEVPPDLTIEPPRPDPGLFGSWAASPALQRFGITPALNLTSDIQGNPGGGMTHGFRQFTNIFAGLEIDLQTLLGAPGTTFFASFSERFGSSLTDINIGNTFNVAEVCCGTSYRVVDVYLEQPMFKDKLNIRAGRQSIGDEFLASPLYGYFLQTGIDSNPYGLFENIPSMSAYPQASWAARVRVAPINEFDVMAAVFDGDRTLDQNSKHGLDWSNRGPAFYIAEMGYHLNKGSTSGLPGNYKLGMYYDNDVYENFLYDSSGTLAPVTDLPPETRRGNSGYYILLDQMIFRQSSDPDNPRGITPFIAYLLAPNSAYNVMPIFIDAGLVYMGPFAARDKDAAGIGFVYGTFSNTEREAQRISHPTSPTQNFEFVTEVFYLFQVKPWLKIQPDIQFVDNPDGTGEIPDAWVFGGELGITF